MITETNSSLDTCMYTKGCTDRLVYVQKLRAFDYVREPGARRVAGL